MEAAESKAYPSARQDRLRLVAILDLVLRIAGFRAGRAGQFQTIESKSNSESFFQTEGRGLRIPPPPFANGLKDMLVSSACNVNEAVAN
jgi:hypothetical protein